MPSNDQKSDTQIIKDGKVITDEWQLVASNDEEQTGSVVETKTIIPLSVFEAHKELVERDDIGVWITNDVDIHAVADSIIKLPVIAIDFPTFMDGRGFSLARLLRERYDYKGEIRATGYVIRDQLCYLKRCGFNAFSFDGDIDLESTAASLNDLTEAYQTSVDKPSPLFRRRA